MREFTIFFRHNNRHQKAGVVKCGTATETEYDVRPVDPSIVRRFGKQIRILKKAEKYFTSNHFASSYKVLFRSLVRAIRLHEMQNT